MKALILSGGFARRMGGLARDIPKCLLEVSGKPILNHILEKLEKLPEIKDIIISTNSKFEKNFQGWISRQETCKSLELVTEPSMREEEKLGSIGAISWLIQTQGIQEDILCIFGDNLFSFELSGFVEFFREKQSFCFGLHKYSDKSLLAGRLGVVEIDSENKVIGFEEKPLEPKSLFASTGIYIIPAKHLSLFSEYIKKGHSRDAFGNFVSWLYQREPVYGYVFSDSWFDIGTPESYKKARESM